MSFRQDTQDTPLYHQNDSSYQVTDYTTSGTSRANEQEPTRTPRVLKKPQSQPTASSSTFSEGIIDVIDSRERRKSSPGSTSRRLKKPSLPRSQSASTSYPNNTPLSETSLQFFPLTVLPNTPSQFEPMASAPPNVFNPGYRQRPSEPSPLSNEPRVTLEPLSSTSSTASISRLNTTSASQPSPSPPRTKPYSLVAKRRWICWGFYLGLGFIVIGVASEIADSFKNTPARIPYGVYSVGPLVHSILTMLIICAFWTLDVLYPITWVSAPIGELTLFTSMFVSCFGLPVAIITMHDGHNLRGWSDKELMLRVYSVALVMFLQAMCLLISAWCTLRHVLQNLNSGRKDVFHHPTCRFDPDAPPPSWYFSPRDRGDTGLLPLQYTPYNASPIT